MTIPQIRGMYAGDQVEKRLHLLIMGSDLPSAKDNRPLNFDEFESHIDQMLFVSATPSCVREKSMNCARVRADNKTNRSS